MTDDSMMFLHCKRCLAERPDDQSPEEWARIRVAVTDELDVRVECVRHDMLIVELPGAGMIFEERPEETRQ